MTCLKPEPSVVEGDHHVTTTVQLLLCFIFGLFGNVHFAVHTFQSQIICLQFSLFKHIVTKKWGRLWLSC